MESNKKTATYNLSELTAVAFDTVQEATRLSLHGYSKTIRVKLDKSDPWTKGWFSEGIGQGLYLHDLKKNNDFEHTIRFLNDNLDSVSRVAAYVGIGMAVAHIGEFSETFYDLLDQKDRPWLFDGLGFYNTLVSKTPGVEGIKKPEFANAHSDRKSAFYSGVGRGLWFLLGESRVDEVLDAVRSFPEAVQPWVWRGLGFVSTYAGASEDALDKLKEKSGDNLDYLKIGCVIAVVEQGKADVAHRDLAARTYIGKGIDEIVDLISPDTAATKDGESVTDAISTVWMRKTLDVLS